MSDIRDFDFLFGRWSVRHRRLRRRGWGSAEWDEYLGTAETRPLLDGLCNIEEHLIAGSDASGVALRSFNRVVRLWEIYWVSGRDGLLQRPVSGGFDGDLGSFEGEDADEDRPIHVRFAWDRSGVSPRWTQSFSYDRGATWELNWMMRFERLA